MQPTPQLTPSSAGAADSLDMQARIAGFDWSSTPLGDLSQWPACLRTTVDTLLHSPLPMTLLWGPQGVMIYNDAYAVIAGGHHPRSLGMPVLQAWPEVAEFNREVMRRVLAGESLSYQNSHLVLERHGSAEDAHFDLSYSPVCGEDGQPAGVLAIVVETTRKVAAESALLTATQRLGAILDGIGDCFYAFDPQLRFTYFNTAAELFFGRDRSQVLGRPLPEAFPESIGSEFEARLRRALATGQPDRFEMGSPAGQGRWIDMRVFPTPEGLGVGFTDITERRMAEAALHGSEKRFRTVTEALPQLIWTCLPDGRCDYLSRQWVEYTGIPEVEQLGLEWLDLVVHPDDRERVFEQWKGAVAGRHVYDIEYRIRRHDGSYRWFKTRATPLRDRSGRTLQWFGTATDIEDLVQARELQGRLRDELEQLVQSRTLERDRIWNVSMDLLLVADIDGAWLSVNPAWTATLGWQESELVGQSYAWLVHPEDRAKTAAEIASLAGGNKTQRFENRFRHKQGGYRTLSWMATPENRRIYAVARDVTAEREAAESLRHAEEALRQAQKMDAIGQLTGGIAHDFNNLLQGIIGSLEIARRQLDDASAPTVSSHLDDAMTAATRAAELTHRLLAFARRQSLEYKSVCINDLIDSMMPLLARTLGPQIRVEYMPQTDLWPARCDVGQLESALLNLSLNARDAMPQGGVLRIATANRVVDAELAAQHPGKKPGEYVSLTVSDNGSGMTPDVVSRAFDPFFTTKPIGQGTGLGLSMIYGFAKQSGGHVWLDSIPGEGTTVQLCLPRDVERPEPSSAAVSVEEAATGADETPEGRGETILVVEDNEAVRLLVTAVLRELGYSTLEAHDGETALPILESAAHIDLMISDVGLPGMNGRQLAEIARELRPDLPVLFATGYAAGATVRGDFLDTNMAMVSKPFTLEELAQRVSEMLGRPG